jgi:peptidoglycan/LPS O-acetylase OafA/YrhL
MVKGFIILTLLPTTWFMFILLQMYIVFPFLYFLLNKFKIERFLIITFIIKVIVTVPTLYFSLKLNGNINSLCPLDIGIVRSFEFCLGMAAAKYFVVNTDKFKSMINSWKFILLAIFCEVLGTLLAASSYRLSILGLDVPMGLSVSDAFIGLGFTGIMYTLGRFVMSIRICKTIFEFLSKYSYEAYLVHIFCIYLVFKIFSFVNLPSLFQFSPLIVIAISFVLLIFTVVISLILGFLVNLAVKSLTKFIPNRVKT